MRRKANTTEIEVRTWQMSFNDLLTVLLTFFILLVASSDISATKVRDVSASVAEVFGNTRGDDRQDKLLKAIGRGGGVDASAMEGGISIVLAESLVYPSGSADIINRELLRGVGEKLKAAGSILVEGHTDSIPATGTSFPSNWELSALRAVNVVKFLAEECGIDPHKLSAAGYADSRPVAANDTAEGRAKNRRVNLIVKLQ